MNAASQISSLSGLAANASCRMARAAGTSPPSHASLAPISHSTSACGQYVTARRSSASRLARVPAVFSSCAARSQMLFLPGNTSSACA